MHDAIPVCIRLALFLVCMYGLPQPLLRCCIIVQHKACASRRTASFNQTWRIVGTGSLCHGSISATDAYRVHRWCALGKGGKGK